LGWLICFAFIILFFILINNLSFFSTESVSKTWINLALGLKILAGFTLVWIYTGYYSNRSEADIFKYYDDALVLNEILDNGFSEYAKVISGIGEVDGSTNDIIAKTRFWDKSPSISFLNDNRLIIKFNAIVALFSLNNIYLHMVIAGFLAFIGLFFLFKTFQSFTIGKERLLFLALFVTPSVLLWSSGILKESFMILGLGGLSYFTLKNRSRQFYLYSLFMMLLFSWVLIASKLYLLLVFIPPIVSYYWSKDKIDGKNVLRYAVINILFVSLLLSSSYLFQKINIVEMLIQKQYEFKCLTEWIGAGSAVFIPDLQNNLISFIVATPYALYNTLFRPGIFDINNGLMLLAAFELLVIILFILISISFRKRKNINVNFVLFCLNFSLLLSLLIGWTTPVLGAIVRYRIPIIIFVLVMAIHVLDKEKMVKLRSNF